MRDWEAVRVQLVQVARRQGIAADLAEDLAHDAIEASLLGECVAHPVAYALASMHNKIALHRRASAVRARGSSDWLLAAWCAPPVPSIEVISVGAAIEHLGGWRGSGWTQQLVLPDTNLDTLAAEAAAWWGDLIHTLDHQPVGERQRRRYRVRALELVTDAISSGHVGVRVLDPLHDRERIERVRMLHASDDARLEPSGPGVRASKPEHPVDYLSLRSGVLHSVDDESLSRVLRLVERIRYGR